MNSSARLTFDAYLPRVGVFPPARNASPAMPVKATWHVWPMAPVFPWLRASHSSPLRTDSDCFSVTSWNGSLLSWLKPSIAPRDAPPASARNERRSTDSLPALRAESAPVLRVYIMLDDQLALFVGAFDQYPAEAKLLP